MAMLLVSMAHCGRLYAIASAQLSKVRVDKWLIEME